MNYVKSIFLVFAMLFSFNAFAGIEIDPSKLSNVQKLQLEGMMNAQTNAEKSDPTMVTDQVERWSNFGKNLATAFSSAAKELGIAVIEFSKTDIGKITTFVIVYKLIGSSIVSIVLGFVLLIFGPIVLFKIHQKITIKNITREYQDRKFLGIIPYKKEIVHTEFIDNENAFWISFWLIVLGAFNTIMSVIIILR